MSKPRFIVTVKDTGETWTFHGLRNTAEQISKLVPYPWREKCRIMRITLHPSRVYSETASLTERQSQILDRMFLDIGLNFAEKKRPG